MNPLVKILKAIFLASLLSLVISSRCFAQVNHFHIGLNASTISLSSNSQPAENLDSKIGFHVGMTKNFLLGKKHTLESGLFLNMKGFNTYSSGRTSFRGQQFDSIYEDSRSLLYLEVPLLFKAHLNSGRNVVSLAYGPYLGLGILGTYDIRWQLTSVDSGEIDLGEQSGRVEWGDDSYESTYRRLDYGAMLGVDVAFSNFDIRIMYSHGLANISPEQENGFSINHRVLSLTMGYNWGKKSRE